METRTFNTYIFAVACPASVLRRLEVEKSMSGFSLLLNVLWIVFGGAYMAFGWIIAAVIMAITIIGIPWMRASFNIAYYTLLPFGQKAVSRAEYLGRRRTPAPASLGFVGNLIWLILAGWWLALGHLVTAIRAVSSPSSAFRSAGRTSSSQALRCGRSGEMIVPADQKMPVR